MFLNGSFAKRPRVAHMFNHGWWRLAVGGGWWRLVVVGGGWWLVIGGWWRLAVVGGWRLVAAGGQHLVAAGGWRLAVGGWRLAVGGGKRLTAVGGWWLVVGGPLGRSLRAVLNKKKIFFSKNPPGWASQIHYTADLLLHLHRGRHVIPTVH